jgi:hypothetical protein
MSNALRRVEIPIAITIVCMLIQVIPYYVDIKVLNDTANTLQQWVLLVVTMATFVGLISVAQVHIKPIQKQSKGWYFSLIIIACMVVMAVTGLPLQEVGLGTTNAVYDFLFRYVQTPLEGTTFSLLAFFITSAAYRAFRARNIEASLVLISGILMVCYNAPIFTTFWSPFKDIGTWINSVPNAATMRAVTMGAALGTLALAVRTLMGIERGYLRGGGGE